MLPETVTADHPARTSAATGRWSQLVRALRQSRLAFVLAVYFLFVTAFSVMTASFGLFTLYRFGFDAHDTGWIFAFVGVVGAGVQGGLIGRLVKAFGEPPLVIVGALLFTLSLVLIPFTGPQTGTPALLALGALFALGNGLATPSLTSLASKSAGAGEQGGVLGVTQSVASLARVVGPLLSAALIYSAVATAGYDGRAAQHERPLGRAHLLGRGRRHVRRLPARRLLRARLRLRLPPWRRSPRRGHMKRRLVSVIVAFPLLCHSAFAQTTDPVRDYRRANEHRILREFVELLSIPNVASDAEGIRRNAARLVEMLKARGLKPRLLEASTANAPPAVYGEWTTPGATQTIVLYAHYDGQPTDARKWTGTQPWEPALRSAPFEKGGRLLPMPADGEAIDPEWRLYARSASDDKAGVISILTAFDALRAKQLRPTVNLKFFFEGEEEAGSPHLVEILSRHKELLASDAWVICDGPVHQSGRKQVVFGVRGDTNVEVTVYGPKRPLHSGHYGNWAPNPAMLLARLLASMKDERGRVTIKGWYDDVEPSGRGRAPRALGGPGLRQRVDEGTRD